MRRTLIAGAIFLLAGAGATSVVALDRNGNGNNLGATKPPGLVFNGSDTLLKVTREVISLCPGAMGGGITTDVYKGGGSGTGETAMKNGAQQLAPMSRSLANTAFCTANFAGVNYDADGVDSCGGASDNIGAPCAGETQAITPVQSTAAAMLIGLDGIGIVASPATTCAPPANAVNHGVGFVGAAYTPTDSFDTLRLLYYGQAQDATVDCNSATRTALIRNWANILNTPCAAGNNACSAGLKHAWRRGDLSGTTDAFTSIVTFVGPRVSPFCNADPGALNGRGDHQDFDPIRVPCDPATDDVCSRGDGSVAQRNTLGVVLPVQIPDVTGVTPAIEYPANLCDPGACALVSPAPAASIAQQMTLTGHPFKCPGGTDASPNVFLNRCFQTFQQVGTTQNFACHKDLTDPTHCFGTPANVSVGVYNLPTKNTNGTEVADTAGILFTGSFYHDHSLHSPSGVLCTNADDTTQIGCLTRADQCTVGFAGRESAAGDVNALLSVRGPGQPAPVAAFGPGGVTDNSTITALLVTPGLPGSTPLYPIARRLYINSLLGYGNLRGGERALATCFGTNSIVTTAISDNGFVPIPGGVQCLDYDETHAIARPPANIQGSGNISLAGCAAGADTGSSCGLWPIVP